MNNTIEGVQRAFILWMSGLHLDDVRSLVEVESLMERGVMVELEPERITGPQAQHYQLLSGRSPSSFGFFDTQMPLCHLMYSGPETNGYSVLENVTGRDVAPKMLPDLLHGAGWTTEYHETTPADLIDCMQRLTQPQAVGPTCKIVKCTPAAVNELAASSTSHETLNEALRLAASWVGEDGMLALLSDIRQAPVESFVNINNYLAEIGLLERDTSNNQISWQDSLAYYVGHGQLWINLMGREPQGVIHPQNEYDEVCETLSKVLPAKLCDPQTGKPVIERVYRKEELYSGQYLFCAPDLVISFKPGYLPSPRSARLEFDEATFVKPAAGTVAMAGAHPSTVKGFLLVSAPPMACGESLSEPAPLTSVVPSLLHALDVANGAMDSSAISGLFQPSYLETHPIQSGGQEQELSEEDEMLIIDRLRDLGYV